MTSEIKPPQKKKEQRIKVSLKENPKAKKESLEKNKIKNPKIAPPMPKGKQLKELVKKPLLKQPKKPIKPKPINKPKPKPKPKPVKKTEPIPSEKPYIPVKKPEKKPVKKPVKKPEKVEDKNVTKKPPKEHNKLYSFLSQEVEPEKEQEDTQKRTKRESRISQDIKEAYGDTFGELSEGEQKYILDNQEIMRRITQQVLNRVGGVNLPNNLRVNEENIIEFYLYPNGDISDIKFVKRSGFYILDDTTKETIEYAYSRYPRPKQKTLIRYKVGYYLRGY